MEIIRSVVERFSLGKNKPVFVSGDWNSFPDSVVLDEFGKFLKVVSDVNACTFHGSAKAGPKELSDKKAKKRCIDYIAVDSVHAPHFSVSDARVVEERVASDHAPIVVTVARQGTRP